MHYPKQKFVNLCFETVRKMKILFQKSFLASLFLFISVIAIANPSLKCVKDDPEEITIEETTSELSSQNGRSVFPIRVLFYRSSNMIEVYFIDNVGAVQVTVGNTSIEAIESYYLYGTQGGHSFYISGISGTYIITLCLNSGEVYSGSWIVE